MVSELQHSILVEKWRRLELSLGQTLLGNSQWSQICIQLNKYLLNTYYEPVPALSVVVTKRSKAPSL